MNDKNNRTTENSESEDVKEIIDNFYGENSDKIVDTIKNRLKEQHSIDRVGVISTEVGISRLGIDNLNPLNKANKESVGFTEDEVIGVFEISISSNKKTTDNDVNSRACAEVHIGIEDVLDPYSEHSIYKQFYWSNRPEYDITVCVVDKISYRNK